MGEALDWVRRRQGPLLAGVALAALLVVQGWPNWLDSFAAPDQRRWQPVLARYEPLFRWLGDRGIDRAYLVRRGSAASFESSRTSRAGASSSPIPGGMQIVDHGRLVDADREPGLRGIPGADPAASARISVAIGVEVRETAVGARRVLEMEPTFTTTFVPLARSGWTATASDQGERAVDLLDGDAASAWDTRRGQAPDQWLAVDLGAARLVSRVDLLAIDWLWVPGGVRVDVSLDGQRWDTVRAVPEYWGPLFFSEHHAFLKVRRGRVQAIFPPVQARHVRVAQTASVPDRPWAARELFVYGPGGPRPAVPPPGELTAALRREGIRFVYANHWLSARVRVESRGAIGAQESNINVNDYSRTEPDPTELVSPRLEAGHGILLGADADAAGVRAMLAGQPVTVRESQAGPYRLLALEPAPPPRRLDKTGWRATASEPGPSRGVRHRRRPAHALDLPGARAARPSRHGRPRAPARAPRRRGAPRHSGAGSPPPRLARWRRLDRPRAAHLGRVALLDRLGAPQERRTQVGRPVSADQPALPPARSRRPAPGPVGHRGDRRPGMTATG